MVHAVFPDNGIIGRNPMYVVFYSKPNRNRTFLNKFKIKHRNTSPKRVSESDARARKQYIDHL